MKFLLPLILLLVWCGSAQAKLFVPSFFSDNMVMQEGKDFHIWGVAEPETEVIIRTNIHEGKIKTAPRGHWKYSIPADAVTGTTEMTLISQDDTILIKNILVGEVWHASGQSNMARPLAWSSDAQAEIKSANFPEFRLYLAPQSSRVHRQRDLLGRWVSCSPQTAKNFSAVAYYFGKQLHQTLQKPVGIVATHWGGTPIQAWLPPEAIAARPDYKIFLDEIEKIKEEYPAKSEAYKKELAAWNASPENQKKDKPRPPRSVTDPRLASRLFNGMIAPLRNFSLRGMIWYQGESNAWQVALYKTMFSDLVESRRQQWNDSSLPIYTVQLPGFLRQAPHLQRKEGFTPQEHYDQDPNRDPNPWAFFREAQDQLTQIPHSEMVVTLDAGEPFDIHPADKKTIGLRLARLALDETYQQAITGTSARFANVNFADGKAVATFHAQDRKIVIKGNPQNSIAIAGEDRVFYYTDFSLEDNILTASHPQVAKPTALRYAWGSFPNNCLYTEDDLPVAPFRTDNFPLQREE